MLTKGEVLEHVQKNGLVNSIDWLSDHDMSARKPDRKSYRVKLEKVQAEYKSINKSRSKPGHDDRLLSFTQSEMPFPVAGKAKGRKIDKVDLAKESQFLGKVEALATVSASLGAETFSLKEENKVLKLKLKVKNQSRVKLEKRLRAKYDKEMHGVRNNFRKMMKAKSAELKRVRARAVYNECRGKRLIAKQEQTHTQVQEMKNEVDNLQDELRVKDKKIKETEQRCQNLLTENEWLGSFVNNELRTFDEHTHSYTAEMQQCVYSLLQHNVSTTKIPLVIKDVLQLGNMKASHLPSKSTCNNMNIQRLSLMQSQLAEEFSSKENTSLLSDETSKFGRKFEGFHAVDNDGRVWMLGLRQMATKSGQDAMDTLKEILSDIDATAANSDSETSKNILINIVATMSDRASTQMKFNELLEKFRCEVLKETLPWDELSEDEKQSLSKLCNFFCSLHVLVHLAEGAEKALVEIDKMSFTESAPILDPTFRKDSESGTTRMVRTASKAFARGGDEKNGVHGPFMSYIGQFLKEKHLHTLPLERFRGNRFNILFSNAASVYFLSDHMLAFFQGGASNRLLQSVNHDLKTQQYLAGCRALGLVSELITRPLWSRIEDSTINILQMKEYYAEIINYMQAVNYQQFIEGKYLLGFVNHEQLNKSEVFQRLIEPSVEDGKVIAVLEVMLPILTRVMQRLFEDYLPGGKWFDSSPALEEKLKGTPKHNKFSETVFGQLDCLFREKPNISIISAEAVIAFSQNKTMDWLLNKDQHVRTALCHDARKRTKELRKNFKERQRAIEQETRRQLEEKLVAAQLKEENRIRKMEGYVNEVQVWGLWQSVDEVDSSLKTVSTKKDKTLALKAQINFRKHVLKQTGDASTYSMSRKVNDKRENLSIEEMTLNVKTLINQAYRNQPEKPSGEGELQITGRKIQHAFIEDDEKVWYFGVVISQVPGYPTWYNIKYSGDEAIYTSKLMDDYKIGDMKLVVD